MGLTSEQDPTALKSDPAWSFSNPMRIFSTCLVPVFVCLTVVLPSTAFAQGTVSQELKKSDTLLSQGHFFYEKSLFSRDLNTPSGSLPPGVTITLNKEDQIIKSEVELVYSGDRFVRRVTDIKTGARVEESFDGTYFCRLTLPAPSETDISPNIVVERKGPLLNQIVYPEARAFTVYPGPMLFQGRGLTRIKPDVS
ncbi:hypothetical protein LC612_43620, partial [Nostoc sp. CHAB 5834]|nr:hypothetical protein [Nostoc sp. CHAB 5834]